jgi:hypothetical protein
VRSDVPTYTTRPSHELSRRIADMGRRIGTVERLAGGGAVATYADLPPEPVPGSLVVLGDRGVVMIATEAGWEPQLLAINAVYTTNAGAQATIVFPVPFANPPVVSFTDGDHVTTTKVFAVLTGTLTATQVTVVVRQVSDGAGWASKAVRIHYLASHHAVEVTP